jgi:hypothetical protein
LRPGSATMLPFRRRAGSTGKWRVLYGPGWPKWCLRIGPVVADARGSKVNHNPEEGVGSVTRLGVGRATLPIVRTNRLPAGFTKNYVDKAACLSAGVGRRDAVVKPTGMYSRRHAERHEALSMYALVTVGIRLGTVSIAPPRRRIKTRSCRGNPRVGLNNIRNLRSFRAWCFTPWGRGPDPIPAPGSDRPER